MDNYYKLFISLIIVVQSSQLDPVINVCDETNSNNSKIYCSGPILEAVNYHKLYNDSKTFVDMPMVKTPDQVLSAFKQKFGIVTNSSQIDRRDLQTFINEYFREPGTELFKCKPDDWIEKPKKLAKIQDPILRQWAYRLNQIWAELCREMNPEIQEKMSQYSLIYVPYNFIVPGGRFREFYYWDAYWIIKGLIASDMLETTKSMILNFASIVKRFGFIPNGGRVYYLRRSQPPFLTAMVYEYFEATHDHAFVASIMPILNKEIQFWHKNRLVDVKIAGKVHQMYQYRSESNTPRPESFRSDMDKSAGLSGERRQHFWQHIASAAESGWDFSTRWFADKATMETIETINIVPADLNAIMCWNFGLMEYLYEQIGDMDSADVFRSKLASFKEDMDKVFYNKSDKTWYDYNLRTNSHNSMFYASNAVPLFANCYNSHNTAKSQQAYEYMKKMGAFEYASGVPSSLTTNTGEQWDFPNGWSPNNHMIIEGLRKSSNPQMQEKAFELATKWVLGNLRVFNKTGYMWEKYNVTGSYSMPGSGGEYNVQEGFGWTNGAILDLLVTYHDRLKVPDNFLNSASFASIPFLIIVVQNLVMLY